MAEKRTSIVDLLAASVVVLLLLAVVAPTIVDKRVYANESSAVATLRAVHAAQLKYAQVYPTLGFADDVAKLGPPLSGAPGPANADVLDFPPGCARQPCARSGYNFMIDQTSGSPINTFRIIAVPITPGRSGTRGFCLGESGIITADPAGGSACSVKIPAN
jgi:type IV pilus assembly protein PilA